jgi:hypothetical protein
VDRKQRNISDEGGALAIAKMSKGELGGGGAWTLVDSKRFFLDLLAFEKLSETRIERVR